MSYLSGDYGDEEETDLIYVPLTIKRYLPKGDLSLIVPYVDISSDSGAAVIDGSVNQVVEEEGFDGSGLGDVIFKGRYYLLKQDGLVPFADLVGEVKLPTADEDEGLGTGEADYSVIGEVSHWVGKDYLWLADLGYTWIGDPSGVDYDNRWEYSVGAGKQLAPEWRVIAYLDGRTAIVDGNDNPLSLLLSGEYRYRDDLRFDAFFEFGLNDGAPDFGLTLGVRLKRW